MTSCFGQDYNKKKKRFAVSLFLKTSFMYILLFSLYRCSCFFHHKKLESRRKMESKEDLNSSLPLPADKMPECWSQDERMNSLFAQFRAKSVNPQDWNSKQKFWQGFIMDYLKSKMKCSFSIAEFNAAFKRNGCSPLCLPNVVEELMR